MTTEDMCDYIQEIWDGAVHGLRSFYIEGAMVTGYLATQGTAMTSLTMILTPG